MEQGRLRAFFFCLLTVLAGNESRLECEWLQLKTQWNCGQMFDNEYDLALLLSLVAGISQFSRRLCYRTFLRLCLATHFNNNKVELLTQPKTIFSLDESGMLYIMVWLDRLGPPLRPESRRAMVAAQQRSSPQRIMRLLYTLEIVSISNLGLY
jgi:hypothetical protein